MTLIGKPELIADYGCDIGENPLWHPHEERLYWTDIPTGRIFRYDPAIKKHEQIYSGRPVGGFTFAHDGGLLLFMDRGTIASWRDGILVERFPEIPEEHESRFNDVIADPTGRVFCGTMSTTDTMGRLYRLDVDGSLHNVLDGIGCSNGMAFTVDCQGFYYTDSFAHEIYFFDYDLSDGSIRNKRTFATIPEEMGLPDGITIDTEGHLWSALWDGGCIVRFAPDGNIAETFKIPAPKTTSLTFGGQAFDELYVTTAGGGDKTLEGPLAGALFRLATRHTGLAERFSRVENNIHIHQV